MIFALLISPASACSFEDPWVWWPWRETSSDTLIVGRSRSADHNLQLLRDGGEIPVERVVVHTEDAEEQGLLFVLVPQQPLALGATYQLRHDRGHVIREFTVTEQQAPLPTLPVLRSRTLTSEIDYSHMSCGIPDGVGISSIGYGLCTDGMLMAMAIGEGPPPDLPLPQASGFGAVGFTDGRRHAGVGWNTPSALRANNVATVWLGTYGTSGAFSGWISDAIEMPDAEHRLHVRSREPEADPVLTVTPSEYTQEPTCEQRPLDVSTLEICSSGVEGWQCREVTSSSREGLGCSTTMSTGSWWALLGLLGVWRKRHPGEPASSGTLA